MENFTSRKGGGASLTRNDTTVPRMWGVQLIPIC